MAGQETDKAKTQGSGNVPGPDVMLGLWASWMDQMSAPAQASADQSKPWWQMTADAATPDVLAGGVKQLEETLSQDPLLRSIDQMWNANPLREVVPVDWAEIARALRTVWLRKMANPAQAMSSLAELNTSVWRAATDAWNDAAKRWWGQGPSEAPAPEKDKRFSAPEWQANPVYRTMKELYLLASDWLMKESDNL